MTGEDIIAHWRKGAQDALDMARAALERMKYDHALFNCHLAVEKALKVAFMTQHGKDHPFSHDLAYLAGLLQPAVPKEDMELLRQLTDFVTDARYSDPYWAAEQATEANAVRWISIAERIISSLLHGA